MIATAAFTATAQQNQIAGDDFCTVLLFSALLVFPAGGLEPAFDVDLGSLLYILANNFSQPLPGDNVVPFRAILPFTALVFISFIGGEAKLCHGNAARRVFDLGVFAKISYKDDLVDALCHGEFPFTIFGQYNSIVEILKEQLSFSKRRGTRLIYFSGRLPRYALRRFGKASRKPPHQSRRHRAR